MSISEEAQRGDVTKPVWPVGIRSASFEIGKHLKQGHALLVEGGLDRRGRERIDFEEMLQRRVPGLIPCQSSVDPYSLLYGRTCCTRRLNFGQATATYAIDVADDRDLRRDQRVRADTRRVFDDARLEIGKG